ncbi:Tetrachloroethene reductive dehalogenase TceA membrane-bound subunit [Dehalococcoides mccartyi]|uniref:Tetrachloroethene reductive dehalogenase TceA membrane-bound subunit n=1 Tax=Dehalococcoides mccartyi TaxID=61435 RepID=A0A328ETJ9_9CHLR|nr:Tetrachloroethene reductive dehalogenase TceA membrane-bound subunit [Dehalococcoides mccartyi]
MFIFTLENIQGSFQENVPKAVLMFVLVTGIPSIILLAIPMIGVWRRGSSRT